MELMNIYNEINERLNKLDFNDMWDGFHRFPFAIYNEKNAVLHNSLIDKPKDFFANTSIQYNGEIIAIWNIGSFDGDYDILTANLVHEMFHCFQNENKEHRYPSDLDLLAYPMNYENYNLKYNENILISNIIKTKNFKDIGKIIQCRSLRESIISNHIKQEYFVETIEGSAEYVGTMALYQLSKEKYQIRIDEYCSVISTLDPLMFNIRRISYFIGTLLLIIYRHNNYNFIKFNDLTVYEMIKNMSIMKNFKINQYSIINKILEQDQKEKEQTIKNFINNHKQHVDIKATICGYDPMNMIKYKDLILCNHFIFLEVDGKTEKIMQPVLLQMEENDNHHIMGYYL